MTADDVELFDSKVDKSGECWNWTGATCGKGYGRFRINGRLEQAHRVAYTAARGPIPDGLQIDHLCRSKNCVRPDHLEAVTNAENSRRAIPFASNHTKGANRNKTHCSRGHEYTAENTLLSKDYRRDCRMCKADRNRRWIERSRVMVAP